MIAGPVIHADHKRAFALIERGDVAGLKAESAKDASVCELPETKMSAAPLPLDPREPRWTTGVECVRAWWTPEPTLSSGHGQELRGTAAATARPRGPPSKIRYGSWCEGGVAYRQVENGRYAVSFARENFYQSTRISKEEDHDVLTQERGEIGDAAQPHETVGGRGLRLCEVWPPTRQCGGRRES